MGSLSRAIPRTQKPRMLVESHYPMGGVATTVGCTVDTSSAATATRTQSLSGPFQKAWPFDLQPSLPNHVWASTRPFRSDEDMRAVD